MGFSDYTDLVSFCYFNNFGLSIKSIVFLYQYFAFVIKLGLKSDNDVESNRLVWNNLMIFLTSCNFCISHSTHLYTGN